MSGYSRGVPAMGDVVRSVLVLGAIVMGLWFVGKLFTVTPENPTSDVDWQTAASGVERQLGFVPLVPEKLPEGWRATTATFADGRWQLGLMTEDGEYVGLSQSAVDVSDLLRNRVPGNTGSGTVDIAGNTWLVRSSPKGEAALARKVGTGAVVITGSADRDELEDFAASLVPYSSS